MNKMRIAVGCCGLWLWLVAGQVWSARIPIIAVDVGHHAKAPGATSARGRSEFEFNRDLAEIVVQALDRAGFATRLIGERGDFSELTARTRAARGADLFLAIHHDSVQPQFLSTWTVEGVERRYSDRSSGFSLFVSHLNPQPERSLACASAIGAALRGQGFTVAKHHAEPIPGESKAWADEANGVYYFDNLVVLKTATMPALLIEAGVIVHRDEEVRLSQPATRQLIADAVTTGVMRCLSATRPVPPQSP